VKAPRRNWRKGEQTRRRGRRGSSFLRRWLSAEAIFALNLGGGASGRAQGGGVDDARPAFLFGKRDEAGWTFSQPFRAGSASRSSGRRRAAAVRSPAGSGRPILVEEEKLVNGDASAVAALVALDAARPFQALACSGGCPGRRPFPGVYRRDRMVFLVQMTTNAAGESLEILQTSEEAMR